MNKFILISVMILQLLVVLLLFSIIEYQEMTDVVLYGMYNNYPVILRSYTSNFQQIGTPGFCYGPWSCLLKTCIRAININVSVIGNTFPYEVNENICKRMTSVSMGYNYINEYSMFSVIIPLMILTLTLEIIGILIGIISRNLNFNCIKIIYSFINITCLIIELIIIVIFDISREKMFYDMNDKPPIFIIIWYYVIHSILGIILVCTHILSIVIIIKKRHEEYLFIN